jgi:eukaryotic-like serine/threonine-protein kinase
VVPGGVMEAQSGEGGRSGGDQRDGLLGDKQLEGRYRLVRRIAAGGMASVYVAEHTLIGRPVAIKILHQQYAEDAECVRRFLDEGRTVGTLGHPHIVESTDMGRTDSGAPFLVLELLEGRTLEQEIHQCGQLPIQRALRIAQQIVSALQAAHAKGIIHRDLKSGNIFLVNRTDGDHVKVLDFGISKFMEGRGHTQKGKLLGTPWFMAPEQINDPGSVDARCDVYSLGVIMYEMLAGEVPFADAPFPLVFTKILHEEPPPIRTLCPQVSPELAALVARALSKSPGQRMQSMEEFSRALATIVGPYWLEMRARARSQSDFEVTKALLAAGTPTPELLGIRAAPAVAVKPPPVAPRPPVNPPTPVGSHAPVGPPSPDPLPPLVADEKPAMAMARIISRRETAPRPAHRGPRIVALAAFAGIIAVALLYVATRLLPSPDPAPVSTRQAPDQAAQKTTPSTPPAVTERATPIPTEPAPAPETGQDPQTTPAPPVEVATVRLTIRSSARNAVAVFRGETYRLPIRSKRLASSDQPEPIELRAPGYESKTESIVLDRDLKLVVDLVRIRRQSASAPREPERQTPKETAADAGPPVTTSNGSSSGTQGTVTTQPAPVQPAPTVKPPPQPPIRKVEAPAVKGPAPGTLDRAAVKSAINRLKPELQERCFERARMDNPLLAGRIVVTIYVDPSGKVSNARIKSSTVDNRTVDACAENVVETWTLPAPAGGVASKFDQPFTFGD